MVDVKELALQQGDILFETFMVDKDFDSIINSCITSTSFMFNVYKYDSESILDTCEEYINHFLKQKHQNVFVAEIEKNSEKEFRILNNSYYVLIVNANEVHVDTVKFTEKGETKSTTWNVNNNYFKDSRYFQMKYIKKMYLFDEVAIIWSDWVRKNYKEIVEGQIGGLNNLLF